MGTFVLEFGHLNNITNSQSIADLFKILGYDSCHSPLDVEDLELSTRSVEKIKQVYLIANQGDRELQVILFELNDNEFSSDSSIITCMKQIATSLSQRETYFLIVATIKYKKLLLMNVSKTLNEKFELVVKTKHTWINLQHPDFFTLHSLRSIASEKFSPQQLCYVQKEMLSYAELKTKKEKKKPILYDAVRDYLRRIGRYQLLKPDEEIILSRKSKQLNELESNFQILKDYLKREPTFVEWAYIENISVEILRKKITIGRISKNRLIESNLKLVVSIARKHKGYGLDLLDLIQAGNLGLIKASEKFEPSKGCRFSTYATWWIRQAITRMSKNESRIIRLPVHIWDKKDKIKRTCKGLQENNKGNMTEDKLVNELDMSIEEIKKIKILFMPIISWDLNVSDDHTSCLGDMINISPPQNIYADLENEELLTMISAVLTDKEQEVIKLKFGFFDGKEWSLQKIGNKIGLTRERVRQIKEKALGKIKRKLNSMDRLYSPQTKNNQHKQANMATKNQSTHEPVLNKESVNKLSENISSKLKENTSIQPANIPLNIENQPIGKISTSLEEKRPKIIKLLQENPSISDYRIAGIFIVSVAEVALIRKEINNDYPS